LESSSPYDFILLEQLQDPVGFVLAGNNNNGDHNKGNKANIQSFFLFIPKSKAFSSSDCIDLLKTCSQ